MLFSCSFFSECQAYCLASSKHLIQEAYNIAGSYRNYIYIQGCWRDLGSRNLYLHATVLSSHICSPHVCSVLLLCGCLFLSRARLCNPMNCCTPGLPGVFHHPPEFSQTHVHWVGDAIQPSHPLSALFSCYWPADSDYLWGPSPGCQVGNKNEWIGPAIRKTAAMIDKWGITGRWKLSVWNSQYLSLDVDLLPHLVFQMKLEIQIFKRKLLILKYHQLIQVGLGICFFIEKSTVCPPCVHITQIIGIVSHLFHLNCFSLLILCWVVVN